MKTLTSSSQVELQKEKRRTTTVKILLSIELNAAGHLMYSVRSNAWALSWFVCFPVAFARAWNDYCLPLDNLFDWTRSA